MKSIVFAPLITFQKLWLLKTLRFSASLSSASCLGYWKMVNPGDNFGHKLDKINTNINNTVWMNKGHHLRAHIHSDVFFRLTFFISEYLLTKLINEGLDHIPLKSETWVDNHQAKSSLTCTSGKVFRKVFLTMSKAGHLSQHSKKGNPSI